MNKIGFIGLGVMGKEMARHLLSTGHEVHVYNRTKQKADELVGYGAHWQDTPYDVAKATDFVLTIVGYPNDVEEVYFSKTGLFAGGHEGQIFIDLTTSTPSLAKQIFEHGQTVGIETLDAPVSGGDIGAKEARLTTMVGGKKETFDQAKQILDCFSAKVTYMGEAGSGQHTKMANQIMIAGTMVGMVETLLYADKMGLDNEKVIEILNSGAAANFSLANYGPRILKEDYSPGFFAKHFLKDLKIAIDEAEKQNLNLPGTKLAASLYEQVVDYGYGDFGTQVLIKYLKETM
ncbi:NAD(P)-dependent oxidoreductase [Fundicoccus culcitae]|uniref:NAD(P)-dependent oxidoreductase n=1 Tax=Fundicoccus culcitae TaxID=2969821 RepID=A0ABY5P629_9LACT|nr:NAD(P)-dependent oxidoreductase [Fundicoccus culcitae]UUX34194.1 NAD(P)-dependent oxidoreductase [Fundicoccus culcitae]